MQIMTNNLIAALERLTDPQKRKRTSHKDCLIQLKRAEHAAEDRAFTVTEEGMMADGHALLQGIQGNFRERLERACRA